MNHPCVNVCNGWATADGVCTGCYRTVSEVANWAAYSDEQKRQVLKLIEERKK